MANIKNAVNLVLSDSRGIYIPRDFLTDNYNEIAIEHCKAWGLTEENKEYWIEATNPESEFYWDAWQWILENAKYTCDNGDVFILHQDGDLWGLCLDRMTDEEKWNLLF